MADVDDGQVELAEAIGTIRQQLIAAQLTGRQRVAGQVLPFAVGKVVIEFSGEVKRAHGASGGVKFMVLAADGKADRSVSAAHKVTIELVPHGESFVVFDGVDAPPPQ